jgi:hypothetical protein
MPCVIGGRSFGTQFKRFYREKTSLPLSCIISSKYKFKDTTVNTMRLYLVPINIGTMPCTRSLFSLRAVGFF